MKQAIINRDIEIMGGTPVFSGTRVPVQTLLDYLEAGESIDEFIEGLLGASQRSTHRISLVRILLDECIDWRLSRDIVGHDVKTARQMGWTAIKNGELLALAVRHFDVFVTVDRSLPFQQDLESLPIAVIILQGTTNRLADLRLLVPDLLAAIEVARRGAAKVITGP